MPTALKRIEWMVASFYKAGFERFFIFKSCKFFYASTIVMSGGIVGKKEREK